MTNRLDTLLTQLRDTEIDRGLDALEASVHRRIREEKRAGESFAVRWAAVFVALLVGTGVGGITATAFANSPAPSLDASAALAPSSLLERRP